MVGQVEATKSKQTLFRGFMNIIPLSEIKRLSVVEIEKLIPIIISTDGNARWVLCETEDIIVVGDLHPAMRNILRAKEKLARMGMPQPVKIDSEIAKRIED